MKNRLAALTLVLLIAGFTGYYGLRNQQGARAATPSSTPAKVVSPKTTSTPNPAPAFNTSQYSLYDPTSPWVVVNKKRPLQPKEYAPDDLVVPAIRLRSNITGDERQVRSVTAEALKALSDAAKQDGVTLTLESGYRSYTFQVNLYNRYVSQQGQAVADSQSARAGHSEHQTGLAADVGGITRPACNVEACFADTPEGVWVASHAYNYGFIIRYPADKTPVTGYTYEPWHLRYVGRELSTEMHDKHIETLEDFFKLPAAPDYN